MMMIFTSNPSFVLLSYLRRLANLQRTGEPIGWAGRASVWWRSLQAPGRRRKSERAQDALARERDLHHTLARPAHPIASPVRRRITSVLADVLLATVLWCLTSPSFAAESALDVSRRFEKSMVSLQVTRQAIDIESPWRKTETETGRFMGVVIPGGRVLTTAWAVGNAVFIEMRRFGDTTRYPMIVAFADFECNLAILSPVDPAATRSLTPATIGDTVVPGGDVDLLREQDVYQMTRVPARLSRVDVIPPQTGAFGLLTYLIETKEEGLGWSEPIVVGDRLVALAAGQDAKAVYGIPAPIIRHFLSDRHDGTYRGFPALYIQSRELVDPALRRLLGVAPTDGGTRVSRVFETSAYLDHVQPDDVIIRVGGVPIGETGFYEDPILGKIPFGYLLNQRYAGDALTLTISRAGKVIDVTARLPRFRSNRNVFRRNSLEGGEPYLIVGGLLFMELSRPYIESWGESWRQRAPINLVYRVETEDAPRRDPNERVVILARVLADDFNRGYENSGGEALLSVNGRRVSGIAQLERLLQTSTIRRHGREWARFLLDADGGEIVLPVDQLGTVHARLGDTYQIPPTARFLDTLDDLPGPIGRKGRL